MVIKIVNRLEILHQWFISFVTYLPLLAVWLIQVYACNSNCTKFTFESMFPDLQHLSSNTMCSKNVHIPLKHSQHLSLSRSLIRSSLVCIENRNSVEIEWNEIVQRILFRECQMAWIPLKIWEPSNDSIIETCYTFIWCSVEQSENGHRKSPSDPFIDGSLNENSVRSAKFNLLSGDHNASTLALRCAVFSIQLSESSSQSKDSCVSQL